MRTCTLLKEQNSSQSPDQFPPATQERLVSIKCNLLEKFYSTQTRTAGELSPIFLPRALLQSKKLTAFVTDCNKEAKLIREHFVHSAKKNTAHLARNSAWWPFHLLFARSLEGSTASTQFLRSVTRISLSLFTLFSYTLQWTCSSKPVSLYSQLQKPPLLRSHFRN